MIKPKKTKTTFTRHVNTLIVKGITWGGLEAHHEYRLDGTTNEPISIQEAKRIAGDFQSLSYAKIKKSKIVSVSTSTEQILN